MSELITDRAKFHRTWVLVMMLAISIAFFFLIKSYLIAIFLAGVFSGLSYPIHSRLERWVGGRSALAAVLTILVLILLVVVPLSGFLGIVAAQAYEISQDVIPWVEEQFRNRNQLGARLPEWIPFYDKIEPYFSQIASKLGELAGKIGTYVVNGISAGTRGTATFLLNLFVMLYAMFFFLMDGPKLRDALYSFLPLSNTDSQRLTDKIVSVTRATVKGTLVIGIVQGGMGGLGFAVAGIKGAAFWATIMAVLSIIPAVGTALVWVPGVIYLFVKGQTFAAIALLIWCAAVVGTVDNVLRPRLVGSDTEMPDLLILLSTLGGLSMFGMVGLIIGPVIAALFLTVWDIYTVTFKDVLEEDEKVVAEGG